MDRPEKISKLAYYLMDKEPLFYLFIINTDFILDEKCFGSDYAGVTYKDGRVHFHYTTKFLGLPIKQMYFVLIHEAYHIFKKHMMVHTDLYKKNPLLANIAEDAIINTEILESKFNGLGPDVKGLDPYFIPDDFKSDYKSLGKDAYVSPRLFAWYNRDKNKEISKRDVLNTVKTCKDIKTGNYGRIEYNDPDDTFTVKEYNSLEDMINKSDKYSVRQKVSIDDLIPVFINSGGESFIQGRYDGPSEQFGFSDSHEQLYESNDEMPDAISQQVFVEKIVKQAREMTDNNPQLSRAAGKGRGNSILDNLEKLIKPEVSWKKIFKQNINLYYSNNSISKTKKKSIITYLMNAKSRYGMLFRHWIKVKDKLQKYVFVAVDTSGSCFSDRYDMERFFSEIDSIAEELKFSNSGRVFVMQWDWNVASEWKEYHKEDWKKFKIKGGGGTNPNVVFDYMRRIFKPVGVHSLSAQLDRNNKDSVLFIPDKTKMPFLIVLTDGQFWGKMEKSSLGLYEKNEKNILFVTKSTDNLFDGARYIKFK